MKPKWQYVILGVCLALWGAKILIDPVYFSSKFQYTFDFSEIKWVFGGGLVIIGSCFVVSSITKKEDDK